MEVRKKEQKMYDCQCQSASCQIKIRLLLILNAAENDLENASNRVMTFLVTVVDFLSPSLEWRNIRLKVNAQLRMRYSHVVFKSRSSELSSLLYVLLLLLSDGPTSISIPHSCT
jgi:hypothetical protein